MIGNRQGIRTIVSVGKMGDEDEEYKKYGIVLDESRRRLDLINVREVTLYKSKELMPDFDYQVQTIKKEKLKEILKRRYAEKMRRVIERLIDNDRTPCRIEAKNVYGGVTAYLDCIKYKVVDEKFDLRLRSDVLAEEEKKALGLNDTAENTMVQEEPARKRIMIIDDDPVSLALTQGLLHKEYDVTTVQSGVEAIPMIMDTHPDIIFLDYEMPDLDGKMTLKMIRAGESMKNIPVFFLTGAGDKEHIQSVLALKPNGYLLKPAKKEHLLNAIKKVFK
ncbi:MAG: response regulator [Lachnospiraceae bacterium]|nr:response regulator [Lachnospiraceae bacterium]